MIYWEEKSWEPDVTITEIERFLESDDSIPANYILEWMKSDDIEALGAIMCILTSRHYARIKPDLPMETICSLALNYYRRCFVENPQGKYSESRYLAGHSLANWFKALWTDEKVPKNIIEDLKNMLAQLYESGDDELKNCIVTSTLEHLFEKPDIAEYFSDWKNNPILKVAYDQALEWTKSP